MILELAEIPDALVCGIYGKNDPILSDRSLSDEEKAERLIVGSGTMPKRARFLHPNAAASFAHVLAPAGVVVSDMLRTGESSLNAVMRGRGAQPPAFSGHNLGLALDLEIEVSMARMRARGCRTNDNREIRSKKDFDDWLAERGWFCHRTDHAMKPEAWHFNSLFVLAVITGKRVEIDPKRWTSTNGWLQALIERLYGDQLRPNDLEVQAALQKLGFYHGALDGDVGPQTRAAVAAFQRAWGYGINAKTGAPRATLPQDGKLEERTRRTIAFIAAERRIEPVAGL